MCVLILLLLKKKKKHTKVRSFLPSWHRSSELGPLADSARHCAHPVRSLCRLRQFRWRRFWPFYNMGRWSWKISQHSSVTPHPERADTIRILSYECGVQKQLQHSRNQVGEGREGFYLHFGQRPNCRIMVEVSRLPFWGQQAHFYTSMTTAPPLCILSSRLMIHHQSVVCSTHLRVSW